MNKWIFVIALSAILRATAISEEKTTVPTPSLNTAGDEEVHPLAIYMVNPEFPESHNKKAERGQIVLRVAIANDGSVKEVSIIGGEPSLASLVSAAIRKWRYVPAMKAGHFVESEKEITIAYRLASDLSIPEEPVSSVPREPKEDLMSEIASGNLHHGKEDGTTPPKGLQMPDPDYSEAARIDKFQGTLLVGVVVASDGKPRDVWVVRPLGHGLDEKAVDAVKAWIFAPAMRNGNAVSTVVSVEVSFRLSGGNEPQFEYGERASHSVGSVIAPVPMHTPSPKYSKEARKNHIEGTLILRLTIGIDGKPTDIHVAKSLGFGLDEKAIEAVRQWRWSPAKINEQPIAVPESVTLDFKLP